MENNDNFQWTLSLAVPKGYPIQIHKGYMATDNKFITGLFNRGVEHLGWGENAGPVGRGNHIPSEISIIWVSYAEKKFWYLADSNLPREKILTLFKQGYTSNNIEGPVTYNNITVGLAPGGVVMLWLTGNNRRVEVARLQAKEVFVNVNDFYRNPDHDTQQEFYDWWFNHEVPKEIQESIKKKGIPYGLWDNYRQRYNWRFVPQFYKEDTLTDTHVYYFNAENDFVFGNKLEAYQNKALPQHVDLAFIPHWFDCKFDWDEISSVFKTLTKDNRDAQIDIIAKVGFNYDTLTFRVKSGNQEIPLIKTSAKTYGYK